MDTTYLMPFLNEDDEMEQRSGNPRAFAKKLKYEICPKFCGQRNANMRSTCMGKTTSIYRD